MNRPPIHLSSRPARGRRRQRGQSLLEYTLACAALAIVLFVPVAGDAGDPGAGKSTIQIVLDAFQLAYQNISYAISLPG